MEVCGASPDRPVGMGLCSPLPRICLCPVLLKLVLGKSSLVLNCVCFLMSSNQTPADDHCRARLCVLASTAVSRSHILLLGKLVLNNFHRLTVPPYAVASLGIWMAAWHSAKTRLRAPYIIGSAGVAIIGKCSRLSLTS